MTWINSNDALPEMGVKVELTDRPLSGTQATGKLANVAYKGTFDEIYYYVTDEGEMRGFKYWRYYG